MIVELDIALMSVNIIQAWRVEIMLHVRVLDNLRSRSDITTNLYKTEYQVCHVWCDYKKYLWLSAHLVFLRLG